MKPISLIKALLGVKIWKKNVDKKMMTLIIPGFERDVLDQLVPALEEHLRLENKNEMSVKTVFDDPRTEHFLKSKRIVFHNKCINEVSMKKLTDYMLVTAKHYGTIRKSNVKLVSFDLLYGAQLRLIASNELYSSKYLITEMILNRI